MQLKALPRSQLAWHGCFHAPTHRFLFAFAHILAEIGMGQQYTSYHTHMNSHINWNSRAHHATCIDIDKRDGVVTAVHLIPLAAHLASSPDVGYGVHKPSVYEAQLIPAEARVVANLIRSIPGPMVGVLFLMLLYINALLGHTIPAHDLPTSVCLHAGALQINAYCTALPI